MGDTLAAVATSIYLHDHNYTIWNKGQLLVIIIPKILAKDTIFIGDKEETLDALVDLIQCRTQWTNYMEKILRVVTINGEDEINEELEINEGVLDQSSFPYRLRDVYLPQDNTGFVYTLISVCSTNFIFIGKTTNLIEMLRAHNSGYVSSSTEPAHL